MTIKKSLLETASLTLTKNVDLSGLVQELKTSLADLERRTVKPINSSITFSSVFDLLLNFTNLHCLGEGLNFEDNVLRMAHFAGRSTGSLLHCGNGMYSIKTGYEHIVEDIWLYPFDDKSMKGPMNILSGKFVTDMLHTR